MGRLPKSSRFQRKIIKTINTKYTIYKPGPQQHISDHKQHRTEGLVHHHHGQQRAEHGHEGGQTAIGLTRLYFSASRCFLPANLVMYYVTISKLLLHFLIFWGALYDINWASFFLDTSFLEHRAGVPLLLVCPTLLTASNNTAASIASITAI